MDLNLARLNHVLIPTSYAARKKVGGRWYLRVLRPVGLLYSSLSQEGRGLFLLAGLAGLLGLDVGNTAVHMVWCGATGLLIGSLLLRRFYGLQDLEIHVEAPARVTVGEPQTLTAILRNRGAAPLYSLRVSGPFLTWDGDWVSHRKSVAELPAGQTRRVVLSATFSARGEHHLGTTDVAALVPGGLAVGPRRQTPDVRFLVLPRVAPVRRLVLPQSQRYQPGGVALASKTGESMDILGVRPYRPGDPVRDLHARTWARTGEPMVREYQQEYFSRVGVVLDTDASVSTEAQREAAISLAAGVASALTRSEALIDLLVVGDRVHPLTLGRSLGHLEQALDLLAVVRPGPPLDGAALTSRLAPYLGRLSAVVLIALAWDDARQALEARIRLAGAGCRTLLVAPPSATRSPLPADGVALTPAEITSAESLVL